MAKKWTPPSDAVETKSTTWTPPTDAVEVKKKVDTSKPTSRITELPQKTSLDALSSGLQSSQAGSGTNLGIDLIKPSTEEISPITAPLKPTKDQLLPLEDKTKGLKKITEGLLETTSQQGLPSAEILQKTGIPIIDKASTITPLKLTPEQEASQKLAVRESYSERIFNNNLKYITPDKIDFNEEKLVPYLKDKFGKEGFVFDEAGAGDEMIVSYTGVDSYLPQRTISINLQPFSDEEKAIEHQKLINFMKNTRMSESEKNIANDLGYEEGQSIEVSREQIEKHKEKLIELMAKDPYKYGDNLVDKDQYYELVKQKGLDLSILSKNLESKTKDFADKMEIYKQNPTEEERLKLIKESNGLDKLRADLKDKYGRYESVQKNYQKAIGMSVAKKEKEGNFLGMIEGGLAQGITGLQKQLFNTAMDVIPSSLGSESSLDAVTNNKLNELGYTEAEKIDYASKELKKTFMPKLEDGITSFFSGGTTTEEYRASKDRGEFEKVVNMLSESLGAAAGGGGNPLLTQVSFTMMSKNGIEKEMRGTDFDGLTEGEKQLVAVPYSLTIGALEHLGFKFSTLSAKNPVFNNFIKSVVSKSLASLPKNASIDLIEKVISKETASLLLDSGLKIVGGALVEGATEGIQKIDEIAIKNISNAITEKDYFKNIPDLTTTEGVMETLSAAWEDAKYGFYGGLIMAGGSTALSSINKKFNENKSNEEFSVFMENMMDEKLLSTSIEEINRKAELGEISNEEATEQLKAIEVAKATIQSIPENLSVTEKRKSYDLINERAKLEKEIEGKDKNLVSAKTEKINDINERLKIIGGAEVKVDEKTKPTETSKVSAEKTTETKTDVTDTNVGEITKPEIQTVEGKESAYVDKEGKFFSEKEVLNMDSKELSEMNLQNPSESVSTHLEATFPPKKENVVEAEVSAEKPTSKESLQVEPITTEQLEEKKAEIEKNRQDEIKRYLESTKVVATDSSGKKYPHSEEQKKETVSRINDEYDVQLVALENNEQFGNTEQSKESPVEIKTIDDLKLSMEKEHPKVNSFITEKEGDIYLNSMFVQENDRKNGIGKNFISDLKEKADKIGKKVILNVTDELGGDVEKLESFYTKNGFEKVGENTYEYDPSKISAEKETKNKFKQVADNIRKLKTSPAPKFINPDTGEEIEITKNGLDWNDLVESVATAVEKTGDIVGSVKEYLGKQDWYNKLSDNGKKSFENQVVESLPKEEVVSVQEKVSAEKQSEVPPKEPTNPKSEKSEASNDKERTFGKKVLESEVSDEIKNGLSEDAKKYVPISNKISLTEADYIIQEKGMSESVNMVLDFKNNLSPRVRVTLGVQLIKALDKEGTPASYYQASQVADEISQFATSLGQGVQVFSLWDKLSADGVIQSYERKQGESKTRIKGKHISTFEGAKEGYKSGTKSAGKKATQTVFGKSKEKASKIKAFGLDKSEIEKRKKAALEKLKKATTKGGGTLTSGGLNKEAIEAVVEYGAMVFADGVRNFKEWSAKIKEVAPELSEDDLKSVWMNNESFGGKTFDELSKLSEIEDIVSEHFTKSSDVNDLSQKLQDTFGLEKELADGLASEITNEFNKIVKQERQKEIDKKTPKLTKKVQQAIDEVSQGENLSPKDIEDIIFKAFGIEKLTEEQTQKIRDLIKERDSRPEGFLKDEMTRETLSYMASLNGISKKDIFWSMYYASILSGYETQILNIASNSLNITLESVVTSIEKALLGKGSLKDRAGAIGEVYTGLLKGAKEGSRELSQILSTGHSARKISQKLEAKDTLENVNFKGGKLNPANYYKYVGRFMFAIDSAAFLAANGSKKQELAREVAQNEGLSGKAMRDRVSEILNESEQSYNEATEQAIKEIEQIDNSAPKKMSERQKARLIKIRTSEIISEMIPDEIQEKANDYSSFVTYNYTPKGILGGLSSFLSGLGEDIKPVKFIVPFTRVVANVLNQQIDYTPYGYLRASGFNFGAGRKNRTTAENINERNRMLIKATIGTIGMVSLYALAKSYEDDDDPYFEISGKGPSDMNKKNQLYSQGWRPYSIKIGDKRISYQYTPFGVALSYIGNWLDNEKYKELNQKDLMTKSVFALKSSASGILDMSFLTGLSGFFESLSKDSDAEKTSENLQKTAGKIGTTFIPNLFKQLDKLYDPTIYDSKSIQASILKEIPIVKRYSDLKPKLNAFGQPAEKQGNRFYQNITKDPVWLFMAKNRIFAPAASPNTHTIYGKEMSDAEFYEYMEKSGKLSYDYFKDNLSEIQSTLDGLEGAEKQEYINEIFQDFRKEVKYELGSE